MNKMEKAVHKKIVNEMADLIKILKENQKNPLDRRTNLRIVLALEYAEDLNPEEISPEK